jgi:hypothetical protein
MGHVGTPALGARRLPRTDYCHVRHDSSRVSKTDLSFRPAYVSQMAHSCVIVLIMQIRLWAPSALGSSKSHPSRVRGVDPNLLVHHQCLEAS